MGEIDLDVVFDRVEVESDYLKNILQEVLVIISRSTDVNELGLGPIIEGPTLSGEAGEVTEAGNIRVSSEKLQKLEPPVAMAIIAHEMAHSNLKHYHHDKTGLQEEEEADTLAKKWGFEIDYFREVCGQAIDLRCI